MSGDAIAALLRLVVGPLGLDQTGVNVVVALREDRIRIGPVKLVSGPASLRIELAA